MTEHENDRAEQAFTDALREHADDGDFQPLDLSGATKASGRRGLPGWIPVAAAVALIAAIAVPVVLNLRDSATPSAAPGDRGVPAPEATVAAQPTAARSGWRWESRRTLSYQVPDYWQYGWSPASDWCGGERTFLSSEIVDIAPDKRVVRQIACPRTIPARKMPTYVSVVKADATRDRGWDLPAGWSVTTGEAIDGYRVEVVHSEGLASVAQQIVSSARPIGDQDPNGCLARADVTGKGTSVTGRPATAGVDSVSACQYEIATGQLLASRRLTGVEAGQLVKNLDEAPLGTGPDDRSCHDAGDTAAVVRLWYHGQADDVVVRYSGCRGNGIFTGADSQELTGDVCMDVLEPPLQFTTGRPELADMCATDWGQPSAVPTPSRTR